MKNELLPTIKKDNIFTKIKKFIMKILGKENIEERNFKENNLENNNTIIEEKNEFVENMKLSQNKLNTIQNEYEKDKFIKQLENDTSILETLSIDRLEKLNNYYDELIEKEKIRLKKVATN